MRIPNQAVEQTRNIFLRHRSPTSAGAGATGASTVFAGRSGPTRRSPSDGSTVSEERLPNVAHAGPAGDGDLRAAGGEARPDAESGLLRGNQQLSRRPGHAKGLARTFRKTDTLTPMATAADALLAAAPRCFRILGLPLPLPLPLPLLLLLLLLS